MAGTKVAYSAEGIEFVGTRFEPAGSGAAPGVLVAHESPGVTEHTLEAARRLAAMGFVALATGAARLPASGGEWHAAQNWS